MPANWCDAFNPSAEHLQAIHFYAAPWTIGMVNVAYIASETEKQKAAADRRANDEAR